MAVFDLERYAELIALRALAMQSVICLAELAPNRQEFIATLERGLVTTIECMDFETQDIGATLHEVATEETVRRLVILALEGWFSGFRSLSTPDAD